MLRVIVETELSLGEPDVDQGYVTWFEVRIMAGHGDESVEIGQARVARIHVGKASNRGEALYDVYTAARQRTPRRWTRSTRNWSPVGAVYLNPVKQEVRVAPIASPVR